MNLAIHCDYGVYLPMYSFLFFKKKKKGKEKCFLCYEWYKMPIKVGISLKGSIVINYIVFPSVGL